MVIIYVGEPCDSQGRSLPPGEPPSPLVTNAKEINDWSPFNDRLGFETADFFYRQSQMSGGDIDTLLNLWTRSILSINPSESGPFKDHKDVYETIDSVKLGHVPWESFSILYQGQRPDPAVRETPPWMKAENEVWFRDPQKLIHNILGNPDFAKETDWAPYQEYAGEDHRFKDFMSGDWAWMQAVRNYHFICHISTR
jgi:hypothetical protein